MKKKLRFYFLLITSIAVFLVLAMTTIVFYKIYQNEIIENLEVSARMLGAEWEDGINLTSEKTKNIRDVRITLIEPSGKVLFDTSADSGDMENHRERPEIRDALQYGEGSCIRESATLSDSLFYYALLQPDGNILRISKESVSYVNFLFRVSPIVIGVVLILAVVGFMFSKYLSESFVRPLENLAKDIGNVKLEDGYEELSPLLETIQKQHKDLIKNSKMRQEFTANVSHELKTPLTSISGYSELIENGMAQEEDARRFAGEIRKSANRLLTLINDILQLSELDSNDFSIDFEMVNLNLVIEGCIELLRFNADKRNVYMCFEEDGTYYVNGNRKLLEELVYNLMDNGIRYNKESGYVKVMLKEEESKIYLSVKDNGIGIKEQDLERVFERFYRVDKSRSKETGGTGLGLAIVKHIAGCHNAGIGIRSKEGEGTEITVTFLKTNEGI